MDVIECAEEGSSYVANGVVNASMLFRSVEGGPSAGEELVELPRLCSLARDCFEVAVATVEDPYEVIVVWCAQY